LFRFQIIPIKIWTIWEDHCLMIMMITINDKDLHKGPILNNHYWYYFNYYKQNYSYYRSKHGFSLLFHQAEKNIVIKLFLKSSPNASWKSAETPYKHNHCEFPNLYFIYQWFIGASTESVGEYQERNLNKCSSEEI
jgi:hypothetical protein